MPTSTTGEKGSWDNCECLAESMFDDLGPLNVHGAVYWKFLMLREKKKRTWRGLLEISNVAGKKNAFL